MSGEKRKLGYSDNHSVFPAQCTLYQVYTVYKCTGMKRKLGYSDNRFTFPQCLGMKGKLGDSSKLQVKDADEDVAILGSIAGSGLGSLPPCVVGRIKYVSRAVAKGVFTCNPIN